MIFSYNYCLWSGKNPCSTLLPVLVFFWKKRGVFQAEKLLSLNRYKRILFFCTAALSFHIILTPLLDFLGWAVSPSTALSTPDQYFVFGIWIAELCLLHFQFMKCWSRAPWRSISNTFGFDTHTEKCTIHFTRTGMLRKRTPGNCGL